jgi:hypothetical protein
MAQHHSNTASTAGRRRALAPAYEAPSRVRSAGVGAVAPGVGRKCQGGHTDAIARRDRQPGAAGAPLQLRPPILVAMTEEQEATAVALLAELIEGRVARRRPAAPDLIFGPVNGLLDPRRADTPQPASPAA